MLTIGLTGGVASGKSLAAKYFAELGAAVLDADRAGHEVLREPAVRDAIVERWGPEVRDPTDEVDRPAVAELVFGHAPQAKTNRRFLEALVHPRIRQRLEAERTRRAEEGSDVFVLDAALLLESGWDTACELVVFVDAPRELRLARALVRGWMEEQFMRREAAQWPVEQKRQHADFVLLNSGTPEELRELVNEFWRQKVPSPVPPATT